MRGKQSLSIRLFERLQTDAISSQISVSPTQLNRLALGSYAPLLCTCLDNQCIDVISRAFLSVRSLFRPFSNGLPRMVVAVARTANFATKHRRQTVLFKSQVAILAVGWPSGLRRQI